ncbi:caspase family protein [Polyangium spumosum]|nr:caspase family protein [Polyangium spumosum]
MLADEGDGPAAVASSLGPEQDHALVVGVNDYPKLRSLRGAIADAQAFAGWLLDPGGGGLSARNVRTILSTPDPLSPLGDEIDDALEAVIEQARREGGRRFYFYFSGHGCTGDRPHDLALCLADWSELRRRSSLSSDAWLDVIIRSGAFDEVAFFLDCCRVWAVRAVGRPPKIDFDRPVERTHAPRVFLAYATEFQRPANEVARTAGEVRGVFTEALVEGLRGAALGQGRMVSAASLKRYLEASTEMRARERGLFQRAEVLDGLASEARFGSSTHPAILRISFCGWNKEQMVLYGPGCDEIRRGDASSGPWELELSPGIYKIAEVASSKHQYIDYRADRPITWFAFYGPQFVFTLPACPRPSPELDFSQRPAIPAGAVISAVAACYAHTWDLDIDGADASSRLRIVVIPSSDAIMSPSPQQDVGEEWSVRGGGKTIPLDGHAEWRNADRYDSIFSARMKPGSYTLRCTGAEQREVAIHLYAGWSTLIVLHDQLDAPHFETMRVFLWPLAGIASSMSRIVRDVLTGFHLLSSRDEHSDLERSPRCVEIMNGESFDEPMSGLLAAHLVAHSERPDPDRIEAIAGHLESLIGPCPDVQALRLRAALLRGGELPGGPYSDPPMLRAGLLAFVEASHRVPEIIAPESALEHACVERLVDSPLSSWPVPQEEPSEEGWLTTTLRELAAERANGRAALDARAVTQELGVPTLAVKRWLEGT